MTTTFTLLRGKGFAEGIEAVTAVMLMAPQFLYRYEQGVPVANHNFAMKLTSWEVASQLSYLQWGSMPDNDGKTLFDNTLLFWSNDLATGPHGKRRLPYLLASGKFTLPDGKPLDTGRYLNFPGRAHNDPLASIGLMMGIDTTKGFGAAGLTRGPLPGLI